MKIVPSIIVLTALFLGSNAFAPSSRTLRQSKSVLFAEGGPPQYQKFEAVLKEAEVLADGAVMLHVGTDSDIDYEPGHVLALEIEGDIEGKDGKVAEDMKKNGGWMRGPYTVSRGTDNSFDILIKVVGDKSKQFANAKAGTSLKFGGKFHVPIVEGIQKNDTKRVVLISTGVGVGPCVGAIEKALKDETFPPVELCANYRTLGEVVYGDYLDKLQAENPGRFTWKVNISSESGRLSASEENLQAIAAPEGYGLADTHYHLIGNGQLVNEFKTGLAKGGVPDDKLTIESYFGHKTPMDDDAVERIARFVGVTSLSKEVQ